MRVLVDTNVLIDILAEDPSWQARSEAALTDCAATSVIVINPIIYAELAAGAFERAEDLDGVLAGAGLVREDLPWDGAFLAGKAFAMYRRRGGGKRAPIADFYVGAHAAVCGYRLLTRDGARYRTYFPQLTLVTP